MQVIFRTGERRVRTDLQPRFDHRFRIDTPGIFLFFRITDQTVDIGIIEADVDIVLFRCIGEAYGVVLLETGACHLIQPVIALTCIVSGKLLIRESGIRFHQCVIDVILAVCRRIVLHVPIGKSIYTQVEQMGSIHCLRTLGNF